MEAAATRLDRRLRARDLDGLPHEWDTRYELIGGVLHISRRPPFEHQAFLARFILRVGPAVLERGGFLVPEPGLVWEDDGEDNVSPDLAILLRVAPPPKGEKLHTCPEIVLEVLSAGEENRRRDLVEKRALYFRRGAVEYWIADLGTGELHRLTRGERDFEQRTLREADRLATPLLEGWSVEVRDLFG